MFYDETVARFDAPARRSNGFAIRQYDKFTAILSTRREEILNSFKRHMETGSFPIPSPRMSTAESVHIQGQPMV